LKALTAKRVSSSLTINFSIFDRQKVLKFKRIFWKDFCYILVYIKRKMLGGDFMRKSNVFDDSEDIRCCVCGKNLMGDVDASMVNIIQNTSTGKIISVCPCCKGMCDQKIEYSVKENELSGWKDLSTFTNPYLYLKHIMSVMNSMNCGEGFENETAFKAYKDLLIKMYPYVTRNMDSNEEREVELDNMMPF